MKTADTATLQPTDIASANQRMSALIRPLIDRDGFTPTALEGVQLMAAHHGEPATPQCYEPGLIIIAQGGKTAYLGDRAMHYGAGHYLVQAMSLPFECETRADPGHPMLGLTLRIDPAMLGELTRILPEPMSDTPQPMAAVPIDPAMGDSVVRLLECLHDPLTRQALGEARIREVLFEALRGPQGASLHHLLHHQSHYGRIARALELIHHGYTEPLSVEWLAEHVNMSPSSFHYHFRELTCHSPLQYQKRIRLLRARLMLRRAEQVGTTATSVGYQSASQFSREYKRYFGISPIDELRRQHALAEPS
ncbi:AraC family transcriptional regulator [Kushneria phosphatilytica]|uniref:AraC family transcriptional regulator n=1 Tax=Kushneria phosphatilytica TaxID=657387 RepID=A0A1S1NUS8_9GAMM|nr:AraC family transcriptional regulator [Kushneria phosphatilytica]OHV13943.1 AraC family transcriptional regulator [Kushneria phosphatilytica]QEL10507.1 AraC family transcriptional regulator [Kushneria phosphatilytica]